MVNNQFFEHVGSDNSTPESRAKETGYSSSYIGENIAAGGESPEQTLQRWMANEQHRANILNPYYTDLGLAYLFDASSPYQHYWVQVFGKPSPVSQTTNLPPSNPRSIEPIEDCVQEQILSAVTCNHDSINAEEQRLIQLINQYRRNQGLGNITISDELSKVANRHLLDLSNNLENYDRDGKDWRFGWSNCPYDGNNPNTFTCLWDAPSRFNVNNAGKGVEIICGGHNTISAEEAWQCWQQNPALKAIILNQGQWNNHQWQADRNRYLSRLC